MLLQPIPLVYLTTLIMSRKPQNILYPVLYGIGLPNTGLMGSVGIYQKGLRNMYLQMWAVGMLMTPAGWPFGTAITTVHNR